MGGAPRRFPQEPPGRSRRPEEMKSARGMSDKLEACRGFRLWATQEDSDKLEACRTLSEKTQTAAYYFFWKRAVG